MGNKPSVERFKTLAKKTVGRDKLDIPMHCGRAFTAQFALKCQRFKPLKLL